jgi:hypothetical protein
VLHGVAVDPSKLWNETSKFFRCHTCKTQDCGASLGDNQIFTDSLYGQMLAHHHFGGNLTLDKSFLCVPFIGRFQSHNLDLSVAAGSSSGLGNATNATGSRTWRTSGRRTRTSSACA